MRQGDRFFRTLRRARHCVLVTTRTPLSPLRGCNVAGALPNEEI